MGCGPCEARRQRLEQLAEHGTPLPGKDWAFYAGWALAGGLAAALIWVQRSQKG